LTPSRPKRLRLAAGLLAAVVLLAACGRVQGVDATKRALQTAGYRNVHISLDSIGGLGLAKVEASAAGAPPAERAAELTWKTLRVRFYTLSIVLDGVSHLFVYEELQRRFGDRDPALDRRQIDEEVVRSGLRLMLLLTVGAGVSVGVVVAFAVVGVRAVRRARGSAD
jgi:hypothetical protein